MENTNPRNLVQFETNLRGHIVDSRVTRILIPGGATTAFDLNPSIDYAVLPNSQAKAVALAQPTAMVFEPTGNFLYVAAFGTDRVAQVDVNGNVVSRIEIRPVGRATVNPRTKRGPRGLALGQNGQHLYVLNRISNTISVVDTLSNSVVKELGVGASTPRRRPSGMGAAFFTTRSFPGTVQPRVHRVT